MTNTYLRPQDAARFLAISKSTFWRWVSEGKLPKGVHLSTRVTVWKQSDLDAFVESMIDSTKNEDVVVKVDSLVKSTDEKNVTTVTDEFVQSPN